MWLPDPLHLAFAPDGLRFCVLDGLLRKVREHGVIPITADAVAAAATPWQPWVEALTTWLAERPGRKFELHVVLFDGFVRYQMLPWRPGIFSNQEWQAYARHRFQDVYGERSANWRIQVGVTPPGESALATAIDSGLLEELRALVASPSKLLSVQPRFVAGYNHWRHKLKGKSCWFAANESGRICLGFLDKGRWRVLRNESHDELSVQDMAELLHRLDLGLDEQAAVAPVYLSGEFSWKELPAQLVGHPLHSLQLPTRWNAGRRQLAAARGL